MGSYSGGLIIGRIFSSEIWGGLIISIFLFFWGGGGGGGGGAYYRNFTVFPNRTACDDGFFLVCEDQGGWSVYFLQARRWL